MPAAWGFIAYADRAALYGRPPWRGKFGSIPGSKRTSSATSAKLRSETDQASEANPPFRGSDGKKNFRRAIFLHSGMEARSDETTDRVCADFSEGRDAQRWKRCQRDEQRARRVCPRPEMDADHNRCVITLAGEPDAVGEAAILGRQGIGTD